MKKKRSKQGRELINPSQWRRIRDSSPGSHGQEGLRTMTEFEMRMEIRRRRVHHKAAKMLTRQEKKKGSQTLRLHSFPLAAQIRSTTTLGAI